MTGCTKIHTEILDMANKSKMVDTSTTHSYFSYYSKFPGFLQKTIKNISFHIVVPGILVCVSCPRSTFARAKLICTFLTN